MARSWNLRLALVAAAALTAACGSTVPVGLQQAPATADGVGAPAGTALGTPGTTVAAGVAPAAPSGTGTAPTRPGAAPGARPGTAPAPIATRAGGSAAAPAAPPATVAPKGPGWDSKSVYVGVLTQKDTATAFSAVGYDGINPGDTEAQAKAIVAAINQRGGVLGRTVVPVFVDVPTLASATNPDQEGNRVCTYFAQDRRVIAVVNIVATLDVDSFRACLAKSRIVMWDAADVPVDTAIAKGFAPYFYSGMAPAWDALAPVLVDRLQAQGWFGGWDALQAKPAAGKKPKIGVLVLENALGKRIGATIKAALAKRGYTDVVQFEYTYPGNNIQPAIAYFSGNGVTHVISSDIELVTFQINADNQRYTPRYGITTYNVPFHNLQSVGPARQQVGAVGIGWAPAWDVSDQEDPGVLGPGHAACLKATAGVQQPGRLAKAFTLNLCDGLEYVTQGANRGKGLLADALSSGITQVSSSFSSAVSFGNGLSPARLFVPGAARDLAWNPTCTCFRYLGATTHRF